MDRSTLAIVEATVHNLMLKHYDSLKKWLEGNGLRAPDPFILANLIIDLIRSDLERDEKLFDETIEKIADELRLKGKPMKLAQEALFHLMRIASLAYIRAIALPSGRR